MSNYANFDLPRATIKVKMKAQMFSSFPLTPQDQMYRQKGLENKALSGHWHNIVFHASQLQGLVRKFK
ncbi:hypothetical protein Y1Q_0014166 [Alligator mississippiensis]|uniref:Uncharacterized protein n=1 Tax=Alligator mississippiensis TaxID=8496 RepID=A0A151MTY9_ALLMI|nr:hypothetical protein Y1Q_0014166 [Alligator mississippiensis]